MIWHPILEADGWLRLVVLYLCIMVGAVAGARHRNRTESRNG